MIIKTRLLAIAQKTWYSNHDSNLSGGYVEYVEYMDCIFAKRWDLALVTASDSETPIQEL